MVTHDQGKIHTEQPMGRIADMQGYTLYSQSYQNANET